MRAKQATFNKYKTTHYVWARLTFVVVGLNSDLVPAIPLHWLSHRWSVDIFFHLVAGSVVLALVLAYVAAAIVCMLPNSVPLRQRRHC